jgi:hypothetical protein
MEQETPAIALETNIQAGQTLVRVEQAHPGVTPKLSYYHWS